ncbi:MAG: hypothetical protein OXF98_03635 [Rhodospirillaceae bacterium]|nr:hypothetical protein [Rhodospirillaceae bacterium]
MRILYGVQTTGRGHLVRAGPMIAALKHLGHEVHTLFSGPALDPAWLDPVFRPFSVRRGLTFVTRRGRIRYLPTALQLRIGELESDVYGFDTTGVDLVVTDYEPLTARIGWLRDIPRIGIGHLYAFSHPGVPVAGANLLNRTIMKTFAPASIPLGLHWHHFDAPILPPTIAMDGPDPDEVQDDLIVVYMPFESIDEVIGALTPISHRLFRFYCQIGSPERHDNVQLRPFGRASFVADLRRCAGVVTNTGFTLISEALHLGKKILTKPLMHQTEQESNALALERLGLATVTRRLATETVRDWLDRPAPPARHYPDVLKATAEWIHAGRWDTADSLASQLWSGVPGA